MLILLSRYPDYVYQVNLAIQVTICLVFAFLAFYVIKWEKLLKEKKWIVYLVSLGSVALIEVRPSTEANTEGGLFRSVTSSTSTSPLWRSLSQTGEYTIRT